MIRLSPLSLAVIAAVGFPFAVAAADLAGKGGPARVETVAAPADEGLDAGDTYGFLDGNGTGKVGDKSLAWENTGRFGRADGRYNALNSKLEYAFTPAPSLQFALAVWGAYHDVRNNSFLGVDRVKGGFDGLALQTKYTFAERDKGPLGFGFSTALELRWAHMSENTALDGNRLAATLKFQAERTLIEDRLYGALNLQFGPGTERTVGSTGWTKDSALEAGAALSYKVSPSLFVGANLRYVQQYSGAFFNSLAGHALMLGPSVTASLGNGWTMVGVWTPQIWGKNLTGQTYPNREFANFDAHQVRFKLAKSF